MPIVLDHAVRVGAEPGLAFARLLEVREDVHPRRVEPQEERLVGLARFLQVVERGGQELLVDGLHALLAEGARVLDLLRAIGVGPAVQHAAGLVLLDHLGIFEIVLVLELLLRVEVVERAEELVESVRGRQRLVGVAQVVLAELRGHVALLLEQLGNRHVTRLQPFLRAGQADLQHAGPEARLAGDEAGAAGRAALLAVPVREQGAVLGNAVDIGSPVAHLAEVVGADVPVADVVAPQNQDVWFLRSHHSSFRRLKCHRSVALACRGVRPSHFRPGSESRCALGLPRRYAAARRSGDGGCDYSSLIRR